MPRNPNAEKRPIIKNNQTAIDKPMTNIAVKIEAKDMPGFPGVVAYQITSDDAARVQKEIDRVFLQVELVGGIAEFRNPAVEDGKYISRGYTFVKRQDSEASNSGM